MRMFSFILVFVGILVMAIPSLNNLYSNYQQEKLLNGYLASAEESKSLVSESYEELNDVFNIGPLQGDVSVEEGSTTNDTEVKPNKQKKAEQTVIGILEINKINLKLPILEGASQANLRYSIGHITGTGTLGKPGNAGLAAHRSFKYGKLFNRLNELETGDKISIKTSNGTLNYKVTNTSRVLPEDVSVLDPIGDSSTITLITCDPIENPTHRLIVHATLVK